MVSIFIYLLILFSSYKCSNTCKNQCQTCQDGYLLECLNLNASSFNQIGDTYNYEIIKYTGNRLFKLEIPLFNNINSLLASLDLSNNKIAQITSSKVFSNQPSLKLLDLSYNRLFFKQLDELRAFELISDSLIVLKLNNAWNFGKSSVSLIESVSIDRQLHSILDRSNLINLKTLEIDSNSLVIFNLKTHDLDHHFNYDLYGQYKDIMCLLPNLERLSLKSNLIEEINFDSNCLNHHLKLNTIELQSNKLNTIERSFIDSLRSIKLYSSNFTVYLENNPFKCDCALFSFYLFLKEDVVADYDKLYCTHEDSFHSTIGKKIIDSKLHHFCSISPLLDTIDTQNDYSDEDENNGTKIKSTTRKSYIFPSRNKNRVKYGDDSNDEDDSDDQDDSNSTSTTTSKPRHHSTHKLLFFIISCIFIAATFMIIFSLHCKKCWQRFIRFGKKQQQTATERLARSHRNYDRFTDSTFSINAIENAATNFDGTLRVDLGQTSIDDENDLYQYSQTPTKKPIFLKQMANKFFSNRKNKDNYDTTNDSNLTQPINELRPKINKYKKTKSSLTSTILNQNNPKIIEESEFNDRKTKLNDENADNNDNDDDDYEYDEETIIDSASILPRTKIVDANANSIIYRTP